MVWFSALLTAGIVVLLMPALARIAIRIDLLDQPGGRKAHEGAIPLVGGIAMFLGFVFGLLTLDDPLGQVRALAAGAGLLLVIGLLDDLHELSPKKRFLAQIIASLLMVFWGGVELQNLGHLVSDDLVGLGYFSIPITVFIVVGVINALNMIDGVDGLAGTVSLVAVLAMLVLALSAGAGLASHLLLLLAAAIIGFLVFNLRLPWQPRARVFMGDAGSLFLGFVVAWFLVDLSQGEETAFSPVVALWIFGLPLIDTVTMMLRRVSRGRSPFEADREHFHHVLMLAGFSPVRTLVILAGAAALMAAVGVLGQLYGVSEPVLFYAFCVVFVGYYLMILRSWRVMRFLRRSINRRKFNDPDYKGPERRKLNQSRKI